MSTAEHPAPVAPLQMTLRQAYETYYLPGLQVDGTRATLKIYHHHLNLWEREMPGNPSIREIDDRMLAEFKTKVLGRGLAPSTFNTTWRSIRAILRRMGPQIHMNPQGQGFLSRIPYVRLAREDRDFPRLASHEELNALYLACEKAEWPICHFSPAEWWRCWLVIGYNLLPRRSDMQKLKMSDFSLADRQLKFSAQKTRKWHRLHLNDVVLAHVNKIWSNRAVMFERATNYRKLYGTWHELQEIAGVKDHFGFHTLRKTGSSWYRRTSPGIEGVILGHALSGVTDEYYINPIATGQLADAMNKLPQPSEFLKILDQPTVQMATGFERSAWRFETCGQHAGHLLFLASYRGMTFEIAERPLGILKAFLATGDRWLSVEELRRAVWPAEPETAVATVKSAALRLRGTLREGLQIPRTVDPLPFNELMQSWALRLS